VKPDAVIFDMDGTLLDTLGDIMNAVNEVLAASGHRTRGLEAFRRGVGWGLEHLVRSLIDPAPAGSGYVEELCIRAQRRYECLVDSVTEPYPGVTEMLLTISHGGVPISVLTNKPQRAAELNASEFFPCIAFREVRGSLPGRPAKPDPDAALCLARRMGSSPGRTLLVGDSEVDILTAGNAGMPSAGVGWGFRGKSELEAAGADFILDTPAEVSALVLRG
jgi:phosphoglycolate phosphatase